MLLLGIQVIAAVVACFRGWGLAPIFYFVAMVMFARSLTSLIGHHFTVNEWVIITSILDYIYLGIFIGMAIKGRRSPDDNGREQDHLFNKPEFKICPACAERIKFKAVKCRYCNEILSPEGVLKKTKTTKPMQKDPIVSKPAQKDGHNKRGIARQKQQLQKQMQQCCPKCGSPKTNDVECFECGIIFKKYYKVQRARLEEYYRE